MTRSRVPSYRLHKQSGQGVVTLTDAVTGQRKDYLLGPHNTEASRAEYRRVLVEWESRNRRLPKTNPASDLTVTELLAQYWGHAETYYRRADGTPTSEVDEIRYALRPLNFLYGPSRAAEFSPSCLKSVREILVNGYEHPTYGTQNPICRTRINAQVKRIRRCFKWAVEMELVGASVHQALCAVAPLKRGRTAAKESEPVKPVARAVVEETLPILRPMLGDMVRLQLETGMRPGELVAMRGSNIDMSGPVWLYRPATHKTAHHGHERIIALGPKAQTIIRRYLLPNTEAFLFSPQRATAEFRATQRRARKTKVQPSQQCRKKATPKKQPGDRYTTRSFAQAFSAAIKRHNRNKPAGEQIPHWHLHQLRHLRALELKREIGLDGARAVLGHRSPVLSEHYAGLDVAAAVQAMARLG